MTQASKVGILGGTFDPIHVAHLVCAEMVRETLALEKVLFIPAGDPPHKQERTKRAATHRQAMVERALSGNPTFELSTVDLDRAGPHYSVDTIGLIRRQYDLAADDCFFIIGGDSLADLPTWRDPQSLVTGCRLAVVHRPGYQPDISELASQIPGLEARLDWVDMPQFELSATAIRERLRTGRSVRYQVLESVWEYIQRHGLYQSS